MTFRLFLVLDFIFVGLMSACDGCVQRIDDCSDHKLVWEKAKLLETPLPLELEPSTEQGCTHQENICYVPSEDAVYVYKFGEHTGCIYKFTHATGSLQWEEVEKPAEDLRNCFAFSAGPTHAQSLYFGGIVTGGEKKMQVWKLCGEGGWSGSKKWHEDGGLVLEDVEGIQGCAAATVYDNTKDQIHGWIAVSRGSNASVYQYNTEEVDDNQDVYRLWGKGKFTARNFTGVIRSAIEVGPERVLGVITPESPTISSRFSVKLWTKQEHAAEDLDSIRGTYATPFLLQDKRGRGLQKAIIGQYKSQEDKSIAALSFHEINRYFPRIDMDLPMYLEEDTVADTWDESDKTAESTWPNKEKESNSFTEEQGEEEKEEKQSIQIDYELAKILPFKDAVYVVTTTQESAARQVYCKGVLQPSSS